MTQPEVAFPNNRLMDEREEEKRLQKPRTIAETFLSNLDICSRVQGIGNRQKRGYRAGKLREGISTDTACGVQFYTVERLHFCSIQGM
jgi:hypothetical protein